MNKDSFQRENPKLNNSLNREGIKMKKPKVMTEPNSPQHSFENYSHCVLSRKSNKIYHFKPIDSKKRKSKYSIMTGMEQDLMSPASSNQSQKQTVV
jgi:hypothetical protein